MPPLENDMILEMPCPCCGSKTLSSARTGYDVDHFGSVLMTATSCRKCGYKHTDVLSLEKREPTIVKAKIRSPADLDIKVVKSGTATIKIPEFGATITPGPYSEGFISNVEGVLDRVEDALIFMLSSVDDKCLKKGERIRKQIQMSKEKPHFTLILEDPLGSSALVASDSSKIQKRKLTKRELQRVKFGQYALDSCSVSK